MTYKVEFSKEADKTLCKWKKVKSEPLQESYKDFA